MKIKEFLEALKGYLSGRMLWAALLFVFALVPPVVLRLYNINIDAIIYIYILCACLMLSAWCVDFIMYFRRHNRLVNLKKVIATSLEDLPPAKELIMQDYEELLKALYDEKNDVVCRSDSAKQNLIDYYTLWAHQIKTPISAMDLVLQSMSGEEAEELSDELLKITRYVEMVLSFARLASNSTDFVLRHCDLDSIVRQAVKKLSKSFIRKKITLNYSALNTTVLTDEKWLVFVVEQVLSNSLKYTSRGSISIYMAQDKTLVIKDTGMGISKEDLPRVFDNGFTGYNGRRDKKSTGIGLYISKRILNKMCHTVTVESQLGKGTTVMIGLNEKQIELND